MKGHFNRLSQYNNWANQRVLNALTEQKISGECVSKFSHVLLAEKVWLSRLEGNPIVGLDIFGVLISEELKELLAANSKKWTQFIESQENFDAEIGYKMLNGNETKSTTIDILTHIFNHGTYHRAQIATLMRQNGNEPVATDFIGFSRL